MDKKGNKQTYFVEGMHCAACEVLIEGEITDRFKGVKVKASTPDGKVTVEDGKDLPNVKELNEIFKKHNYRFSLREEEKVEEDSSLNGILTAVLIVLGFIILEKSGIASWINVSKTSSISGFFLFGLIAGFSSCGALVGGIILSMTKQWVDNTKSNNKYQPVMLFNIGRIISYGLLGAILGYLGNILKISPIVSSILSFSVSLLMIILGLQMLGIKYFQKFQIALPKYITTKIASTKVVKEGDKFNRAYMPFIMGALTFFLPCGFTLTAQTIAITTGSALTGGLILAMFALGTALPLSMIGITSAELNSDPKKSKMFSQVAGILVLFFALYSINAQLNVLGIANVSSVILENATKKVSSDTTPKGGQVIKMGVYSDKFEPNYFKVKKDIPVTWEITDVKASGCTSAIIAKGLIEDRVNIKRGGTVTTTFTPNKVGKYRFSCWMGMVTGIIEVVE